MTKKKLYGNIIQGMAYNGFLKYLYRTILLDYYPFSYISSGLKFKKSNFWRYLIEKTTMLRNIR